MNTVTLPKSEYNLLKKRASLYEAVLKNLPEGKWGVKEYNEEQIKEFMKVDRISAKTQSRLKQLLKKQ